MEEDLFLKYAILKLIIGVFSTVLGVIICVKYKFYNYSTDDMLFATKLKIFLSGLLLILIGICGFYSYFSNYF